MAVATVATLRPVGKKSWCPREGRAAAGVSSTLGTLGAQHDRLHASTCMPTP